MHSKEKAYFNVLKMEVVRTFKKNYPGADDRIEDWKGQTIVFFQDDLLDKVNENISEKWFYNHMKSRQEKLPRIDMLNILSKYCGYQDWQEFTFKNKIDKKEKIEKDKSGLVFVYVSAITLFLVAAFYLFYTLYPARDYHFSFIDGGDLSPIHSENIVLEMLHEEESPQIFKADSSGKIHFKTKEIEVDFVVSAPYYKRDTFSRTLKKYERNEIVKLYTDDYALMLQYFTTSDVKAWKKRRKQLGAMFADNAIIYEVYRRGTIGMEMYDKDEFINKLTSPSISLKGIDILDTEYANGQIVKLRFCQKK